MDTLENVEHEIGLISESNKFITANTVSSNLEEMSKKHVIPVFTKFNEPLISHSDFVQVAMDLVNQHYKNESLNAPVIRVSHPIKGRIPEAKYKPAIELQEHEKTLYYERMAFILEIPTVFDSISGQTLNLTVGGVKAYNLDNYNSNRKDQHFKAFIGLKNTVCTNLCLSTDGLKTDITVKSVDELRVQINQMIETYNVIEHFKCLKRLQEFSLERCEFSKLIGRLKMYQYLSPQEKEYIPDLKFTESQLNKFVFSYFKDPNFARNTSGDISVWSLYNNATEAFKTSYIDGFVEKNVNALNFMLSICDTLEGRDNIADWYFN